MRSQRPHPDVNDDRSSIRTFSTDSTNVTVDDQPGAGRVLGNVYQRLGRTLDKGLAKLMRVLSRKNDVPLSAVVLLNTAVEDQDANEHFDEMSIISNETIDNQVGVGRTIDTHLLQPLGRKLEKWLGNMADRLGFGPNALERKLLRLLGSIWLRSQGIEPRKKKKEMLSRASGLIMKAVSFPGAEPVGGWLALKMTPESEDKVNFERIKGIFPAIDVNDETQTNTLRKISKTCKKLLKHVRSSSFSTSLRTLSHLVNLIFVVPELRHIFLDRDALKALEDLVDSLDREIEQHVDPNEYRTLLTWSRRALLSVQESDVNNAAKDFIYACEATKRAENKWRSSPEAPWLELGSDFIDKARAAALDQKDYREYHFLIIRYARRAWDFLEDVSAIALALSDAGDLNTLSSRFMSAFIRMQEKGIYFTPDSLEPLELALLLTRMSTGISFYPCSVGPLPFDVLDKLKGIRLSEFSQVLDRERFPPQFAEACHIISEQSIIYYVRDPRDESLIYGTVDDLPEPLRGQMRKKITDFPQELRRITEVAGKIRGRSLTPYGPPIWENYSDATANELNNFGKQHFGWQQLLRPLNGAPESAGWDKCSRCGGDCLRPVDAPKLMVNVPGLSDALKYVKGYPVPFHTL